MTTRIVVAGASGNLGTRIVKALTARGADVVALVRSKDKGAPLAQLGAKVAVVDMTSPTDLATASLGAACVVSALQGLRDVIVDAQSVLLGAAVKAGVPRFIPSDFSTDFTPLPAGENRNFDLRREFHTRFTTAAIATTSIYNGAFAEILGYNVPLLDVKAKTIGYWESPDWRLDFTTMDDTAAFTAAAAMDETTPAALHIASFQPNARELAQVAGEVYATTFELVRLGSLDELRAQNHRDRAAHPEGETEVFPRWQRGQYTQSMFSTQHGALDNDRYPDLTWAKLADVIAPRK